MKLYLQKHIAICLIIKIPGGKQKGYLYTIEAGKLPFYLIHRKIIEETKT